LKLRALKELTLHELEMVTGGRDATSIESYALEKFGDGYYCAKLFSTKYGRNILERRYHFGVGRTEDVEDEDYF
jgi:hypothetical protein